MVIYLVLTAAIGIAGSIQAPAQETFIIRDDSIFPGIGECTGDVIIQEDVNGIRITFAYEVVLHIQPVNTRVADYELTSEDLAENPSIRTEPSLINNQPVFRTWDFPDKIVEEELQIEDWMLDPGFWNSIGEDRRNTNDK